MKGHEIKPGDILMFKGRGIIYRVLSLLLRMKRAPNWSQWGWHLAIAVEYHRNNGWIIAEALAHGVSLNWLDEKDSDFRVLRWLKRDVHSTEVRRWAASQAACKYDVLAYVWTAIQIFWPSFPRIIDRHYTCWELAFDWCRWAGLPIQPLHRYPIITDLVAAYRERAEELLTYNDAAAPYDRLTNYARRADL